MEEWHKVLLATFVGFLAGLLMEPLKLRISAHYRRKQALDALSYEIINLAALLCDWATAPGEGTLEECLIYHDYSKYEYYCTAGQADLFLLKNDWLIHVFYKRARRVYEQRWDSQEERKQAARRVVELLIGMAEDNSSPLNKTARRFTLKFLKMRYTENLKKATA